MGRRRVVPCATNGDRGVPGDRMGCARSRAPLRDLGSLEVRHQLAAGRVDAEDVVHVGGRGLGRGAVGSIWPGQRSVDTWSSEAPVPVSICPRYVLANPYPTPCDPGWSDASAWLRWRSLV